MGLLELPELRGVREGRAVLRRGRGDPAMVRPMQEVLRRLGAALGAAGVFDRATEDTIIAFQRQVGLDADGIVGRQTLHALDAAAAAGLRLEGLPVLEPA